MADVKNVWHFIIVRAVDAASSCVKLHVNVVYDDGYITYTVTHCHLFFSHVGICEIRTITIISN